MGLFSKKESKDTAVAPVKKEAGKQALIPSRASVIVKPHITEKAALLGEHNVYSFIVEKGATKHEIMRAIHAQYNVTPVRVNIVVKQPRHSMSRMRGRDVMVHGLRKAYVYLKKGDRIELV